MTMRLYVAAGGGGDAIAAALLHDDPTTRPVILTYAWERLILDPVPGPRSVEDFEGLGQDVPGIAEILATTEARPPARSPLPRLTGTLNARLFLLDPSGGAIGMHEQIRAAVDYFKPDEVTVIDVGGDIIARGDEPGLRSPMADALVIAAVQDLGVLTRVWMAGPGLDGELTEAETLARVDELGGRLHRTLTSADTHNIGDALDWHPTEATRLLVAAARGYRGTVEIRDHGSLVKITDASTYVFALAPDQAEKENTLALELKNVKTLSSANAITLTCVGKSELDYEFTKSRSRRSEPTEWRNLGTASDALAAARRRGAEYLTPRRLAELTGNSKVDTKNLLINT
ncbi:DUF1152 domain-containing protein [Cryptosporangium sp. NPDC048952]|uniref:DUF1152 domain-containing protein n=1 Tax=Cryptosporangium sp. NPDC048952 TaxID=3363961 RepID=UPI00371540F0